MNTSLPKGALFSAAMILALGACQNDSPSQEVAVAPTTEKTVSVLNTEVPEQVYWGDQHVHSGWSADAGLAGTTLGPEDAVRFARGEKVKTSTGREAQLHRALDWIAVTDHSDGMGTINKLKEGDPEMMRDETAKRWHDAMEGGGQAGADAQREAINAQSTKTLPKVMMDPKWMTSAWEQTVDIMERYNEPGQFTAFIAYEWTSNGETGQNLHRNVLFRDNADKTRATPPLTTFESSVPGRAGTDPESLWNWLENWEAKTGGRALAIPHNGNMSNGWMFSLVRYDGTPINSEWAAARERWEPLYEIFQYKGAGEVHPALAPLDEFADYEIWDTADLGGNPKKPGDIEQEYLRDALKNGLALQARFGANPFKYGMVSGSDTHTALMTGGEEDNFWGKFNLAEPNPGRWEHIARKEKEYDRREWTYSAQGITGVWATSNTRAALWDAMKRKETYASSGPRIALRFFAGYAFSDEDTEGNVAANGYSKGVPMGADLAAATDGAAPTFLIAATKDPEAAHLDRVQVIKGWIDASGEAQEIIYDVVWSGDRQPDGHGKLSAVGNTVDLATATYANSIGSAELRAVFRDPDFRADQSAFYYARVLEIPTPRWTAFDVVRYGDEITDPEVPLIIQERAVSSPIWYTAR